jgi:hypothetical protein
MLRAEDACHAALSELRRACALHPTFPSKLCNPDLDIIRRHLMRVREVNDGKSEVYEQSAHLVLDEEVVEMLESALLGDLEAARKECVQAMAMLLRFYLHLPEYCAQAREEGALP